MAVIEFDIPEHLYYDYYMDRTSYILLPIDECNIKLPKQWDTAVLNCIYQSGEVNKGRYLSPVYRKITNIHTITDFAILSIRP